MTIGSNDAIILRPNLSTLKQGAFCFRRCNLKKIAILGAVVVLLGCSAATVADDHKSLSTIEYKPVYEVNAMSQIIETHRTQTMLEQQAAEALRLKIEAAEANKARLANRQALEDRITELQKHVGRTWYVFSGSSPSGWDCSGMTRWFYQGLGIEIEHSASKQGKSAGYHVETPSPGDIVAFSHLNSEKYYHVGIYVGNNKIIHAGFRKGTKTEKISLDSPAFKNSEISFVRVIEN
jgi:cell wall-associated NlpC family hydrolase